MPSLKGPSRQSAYPDLTPAVARRGDQNVYFSFVIRIPNKRIKEGIACMVHVELKKISSVKRNKSTLSPSRFEITEERESVGIRERCIVVNL